MQADAPTREEFEALQAEVAQLQRAIGSLIDAGIGAYGVSVALRGTQPGGNDMLEKYIKHLRESIDGAIAAEPK